MTAFIDQLRNALDGTTPGPWRAWLEWEDGEDWTIGAGPFGYWTDDDETDIDTSTESPAIYTGVAERANEADAALIAAAPELLSEALRRLDPGDTDIEVVIEVLASLLDDLEVEGPDAPYSSAVRAAIRLLRRQAFGESS